MSLVRALRSASSAPRVTCTACFSPRLLHSSSRRGAKKNSKNERKLATASPISTSEAVKKYVKPYTAAERKKLEQKYTPEQLAALDDGEAAVDPEDIYEQGIMRDDSMGVDYLDDYSKIRPWIDNPLKPPEEYHDPNMRVKTDDELAADLHKALEDLPENAGPEAMKKYLENARVMVGKPEAELQATNYVQPPLPKFTDTLMRRTVRAAKLEAGSSDARWWILLSKQTGWDIERLSKLRLKMLVQKRVSNQTRMGKIPKTWVLYIAGDGKGLMGVGEGSAVMIQHAVLKAKRNAIRNMVPIPRYENRTIYGDVKGKVGATELELFTRPPGFGLRCQEKILEMCKCAGISDLSARVTRARNPMNTIKATMQALLKQKDPELVARARGRKMVDVRKVYYAGMI